MAAFVACGPRTPGLESRRMKLRVGVVGLGKAWETRHAPALKALADRFEVRAFCDPVAHRAAEVAQRWPARTCDGFRALAESDDIDAVLLLSARWYGALPILAACDAGKAIYCCRRARSRHRTRPTRCATASATPASRSWPSFPAGWPRPRCGSRS